jgi:toxin ParE2
MDVKFIEPASIELDDAINYYNFQSQGLGDKFFDEVLQTIHLISLFPHTWTLNTKHTRKAVLKKYPYNLIYAIHDEIIYIIAIAHQHRQPEYWIDRLNKMNARNKNESN